MDSRLSGYRPLSESTKSPEEDRWKTPPDRSFDDRNASWPQPRALKLVAQCAYEASSQRIGRRTTRRSAAETSFQSDLRALNRRHRLKHSCSRLH